MGIPELPAVYFERVAVVLPCPVHHDEVLPEVAEEALRPWVYPVADNDLHASLSVKGAVCLRII